VCGGVQVASMETATGGVQRAISATTTSCDPSAASHAELTVRTRGVVLKISGGTPETRLRQRF